MTWQHITYFISIIIAAAVMGYIAWYSRKRRDAVAGAGVYLWIAFLASLLSIFQGLSMIGISAEWARFWFNLRIACFAAIPVLWLVFVLRYVGKTALLSKARIAMLFVIPVITQVMLWTNDMHGLWVVHDVGFRQAGPFFIPETAARVPGPWYMVHNLYTYTVMLAGLVVLFVSSVRMKRRYRGQAIALGAGTLVMMIGTIVPAFNLVPGMVLNPMPQSFALGSLIIAWGLFRYRFLDASIVFDEERHIPRGLVMLFILLMGGILVIGFLYYRQSGNHFRAEVENRLSSIVELKVGDIVRWREERLADAGVLHGNTAFTALVRRFLADSTNGDAQGQMRNWLGKMQTSYHYTHIYLLDARGNPRLSMPHSIEPVCGNLKRQAAEIMRAGRIVFLDLHREAPGKPIHLSVAVPIIENGRPLGLVALFIDPATYLYPMLNRWPTKSSTAETLLVRRDGNDVLFLNEFKYRKNTALNLREPLADERMLAVLAALGREGVVEGVDYRGVPVLAAIRAIPDSPWAIVALMDLAEVYAPLRERLLLMIVLLCALLAGSGAGIRLIWRRQSDRALREKAEAEERLQESEHNLSSILEHTRDVVWSLSWPDMRVKFISPSVEHLYGRPAQDFVQRPTLWQEVVHPEDVPVTEAAFRKLQDTGHAERVCRIIRPDGSIVWVSDRSWMMYDQGGRAVGVDGIVTDITERKQVDEMAQKSHEILSAVLNAIPVRVFWKDANLTYLGCNAPFARDAGFEKPEDLIGRDDYAMGWREQAELYRADDRAVIESGEANILIEEQQSTPSGELIHLLTSKLPLRDAAGAVVGVLGTYYDITARKRLEEVAQKKSEEFRAANVRLQEIMQTQERSRLSLLSILEDEKFARQVLRDSEDKYRTLVENINDVVFSLDSGGVLTYISPSISGISKYTAEELLGIQFALMVHPEDLPGLIASYQQTLSGGSEPFEFRVKDKEETYRYVRTSSKPIHKDGVITGITGIMINIHQQKMAEMALFASEERYRKLIDAMPLGVAVYAGGEILFCNSAGADILGAHSPEELKGKPIWEIIHPDDRDHALDRIRRMLAGEQGLYPVENRYMRLDGSEVPVEVMAVPLKYNNRDAVQVIVSDISEKKRIAEAVRESERFAQSTVNALDANIAILDGSGDIISVNRPWREFAHANNGAPARVFEGVNYLAVCDTATGTDSDGAAEFAAGIRSVMGGETEIYSQEYACHAPSAQRWFFCRVTRFPGEGPVRIVVSHTNITERKRAEDELVTYRDHLEELVRERTTELEQMKVAAEAANRSKTRFLSSMSHEIRTPLNAILGFSELLIRDRELTDKQRERMETVNRSGEHLLGLINDILEISKIEEGRSTITPAPFDLIATLGNIESMFLSKIDAKGLSFRMETAGVTARYIVSDEAKLRQILINLVGNAAKFTVAGGVALRVRTAYEGDGGVVLTADVEDTGPGISETEMAGLFGVFEQRSAGVKTGGTGLGLAISRQFARLMGGDISARSEEGKGSCFTLRIAVRAGESIAGKAKTAARTVRGLVPGQGPFRVLVADDQPDNRMLISEILVPAGFEIMEACDGIETIDLFKSWSPHLILMDKRMPRMNGYEAMVRIKEIDPGTATKIVAVTASAFSEDRVKAMDWGADAYLPKPFKAHELFECVGSMLGVGYVYDEETPVSASPAQPLTPGSLDGLPDGLVEKILEATVGLDRDSLFNLIGEIAANEPETGRQLSDMVKNYQYEALIALLKRRLERK